MHEQVKTYYYGMVRIFKLSPLSFAHCCFFCSSRECSDLAAFILQLACFFFPSPPGRLAFKKLCTPKLHFRTTWKLGTLWERSRFSTKTLPNGSFITGKVVVFSLPQHVLRAVLLRILYTFLVSLNGTQGAFIFGNWLFCSLEITGHFNDFLSVQARSEVTCSSS